MAVAQEELEEKVLSAKYGLTLEVKSMLVSVGNAASNDEGRPILTSVDLTLHGDGRLEAVCTDSYILVHREASFPAEISGVGKGQDIHVAVNYVDLKRALTLAKKVSRHDPFTDSQIVISTDGVTVESPTAAMTVKAVEGEYPNWKRLSKIGTPTDVPGIIFNPWFMHRVGLALEAINGIRAKFTGPTGPILLTPYEATGQSVNWALQMPVRDPLEK